MCSSDLSSSAVGGLVVGVVAWCGDVVRARAGQKATSLGS